MNLECVEKIADAVLYEGYMLYPYRASSIKNQQRWNFGVLCPRSHGEQQNGTDAWTMQTECLIESAPTTQLEVEVRFLQIVNRSIEKLAKPIAELHAAVEPENELVERRELDRQTFTPWQEAIERKIKIADLEPSMASVHRDSHFEYAAKRELEPIRNREGLIAGVTVREWQKLSGQIEVDLKSCRDGVHKVRVRLCNLTDYELAQGGARADVLMHSFVSAHTILAVERGKLCSQLDPPESLKEMSAACINAGTWPVLAGEEGARNLMLSSPIILYDYPQIAPESPGSLFDGTEIDEILSLRILTLTDEEKKEMRQSDQRSREILERIENMPPAQFMKLHGVLRGMRSLSEETQ